MKERTELRTLGGGPCQAFGPFRHIRGKLGDAERCSNFLSCLTAAWKVATAERTAYRASISWEAMIGTWTHLEIGSKQADVFDPRGPQRPRFGVLHLHGVEGESL